MIRHAFLVAFVLSSLLAPGARGQDADQGDGEKPMPEDSTFLDRITPDDLSQAEGPAGPVVLRWDFSAVRSIPYSFEQEVQDDFGGMGLMSMSAKGTLLMNAKGKGLATLVFRDVESTMRHGMAGAEEDEPTAVKMPVVAAPGVREDGTTTVNHPGEVLDFLFPLPAGALAAGESAAVDLVFPVGANGSALYATGKATITLAGYFDVRGRTCARIDTRFEISDLDYPEELEGSCRVRVRGRAVHYFDLADRTFHSGRIALLMSTRMELASPMAEGSKLQRSVIDSDNFIRFDRRDAAEPGGK